MDEVVGVGQSYLYHECDCDEYDSDEPPELVIDKQRLMECASNALSASCTLVTKITRGTNHEIFFFLISNLDSNTLGALVDLKSIQGRLPVELPHYDMSRTTQTFLSQAYFIMIWIQQMMLGRLLFRWKSSLVGPFTRYGIAYVTIIKRRHCLRWLLFWFSVPRWNLIESAAF